MLTARGFWFSLIVFATLAVATLVGAVPLMLVCLTLLFWFLIEWFLFQFRARWTSGRLVITRTLHASRGEVRSIWARQRVEVVVAVENKTGIDLPYVVLSDRVPPLAQTKGGTLRVEGASKSDRPLEMKYAIECRSPGRLRFEGVKLEVADLQGFFLFTTFLRAPREYRVLPPIVVESSQSAFVKQHNLLPLLGKHRHARPGTSSELLDLRDYIPGDPPKTIAWKVSARRDRLITKEFESEVPIRATLFLDTSNAVRAGPIGDSAIVRLVELAAATTQANTSARDLTGLCLFDETGVRERIAPGRGAKHLLKILDVLTGAAGLVPITTHAKLSQLLPIAYGLLQDLCPEWLERDVNHFPSWLPWLAPQPYSTILQPRVPSGAWWQTPWIWLRRRARHSLFSLYNRRRWRFSLSYQREYRWRKQISAILAVRYRLGPGGLAMLLEDDQLCALHVQRFLAEHQVAYPYPLYDDDANYLFADPKKADVLASALLHAVTKGKDNELFVLCVDLLETLDQMGPLARAACVARARHHQVVVICPWPATISAPGKQVEEASAQEPMETFDIERLVRQTSTARLHRAYGQMRQAFGKLGIPVICAAQDDTVDWILHRMRRLRIQERGVR